MNNETIGEDTIVEKLDLDETFTHQIRLMQRNSMKKLPTMIGGDKDSNKPKMSAAQSFISILKAYCSLMILILPRSFARGGYVLSPLAMIVSATI